MEITFDKSRLPRFAAEVAKLVKRAEKIGVPPMSYTVIGEETETVKSEITGESSSVTIVTVSIEGETPQLPGGWSYVGAVEHLEAGNLLHGESMADYRDAAPDCDHCGIKRNRKTTIIVRNEDGERAQVGSTCMKDFLGYHGNPERVVHWVDEIRDMLDEFSGMSGGRDYSVPTDEFMAIAVASVRINGWVAKSFDPSIATAQVVDGIIFGYKPHRNRYGMIEDKLADRINNVIGNVSDEDRDEARSVREWVAEIPEGAGDYLGNLRVVCSSDWIDRKHFGIAASAVSARRKAYERDVKRAVKEEKRAASEFVGTVGDRMDLNVTVEFKTEVFSDFGSKYLVAMTTEDGDTVKTFSSGSFGDAAEIGAKYLIRGTVKDQNWWNDAKETLLTRVTILSETVEAPDPDVSEDSAGEDADQEIESSEEPTEAPDNQGESDMTIEVFVPERIVAEHKSREAGKSFGKIRELESGGKVKLNKTEAKAILKDCEEYPALMKRMDSATRKRYRVLAEKLNKALAS